MNPIITIIIGVAALAVGLIIGYLLRKRTAEAELGSAEEQAKRILEDAIKAAETKKKETLLEILEKFKTCSLFNDLNEEDVAYNLYRENIGSCIDLLDDDLYKLLEDVFSEVFHRKIFLDFDI